MELNYAGMAFAENLKRNPDLMGHVTNPEKLNAQLAAGAKEQQALDEKNGALRAEPVRVEFNRLRREKYNLEQAARSCEVFLNNIADNVREWQKRVDDLLARKKHATADNRLGEERSCEGQIAQLENDLLNEQEKLVRAQRNNTHAARALREWPGAARLVELKKELGE